MTPSKCPGIADLCPGVCFLAPSDQLQLDGAADSLRRTGQDCERHTVISWIEKSVQLGAAGRVRLSAPSHPAPVKHRHGAIATAWITSIAIQEPLDAQNVDGMETLSNEQVRAG